jgi:glycosyltransferase involved in cell wall biosynthesis
MISAGLAVYNGEKYLGELLESVVSQTFTDFEVIISDNASTDRTADICAQFARRDPRLRYYRNSTNIGAHRNFNRVFSLGQGKYSVAMSHDDVFEATHFEKCLRVLEADPNVVLCQSDTVPIGPDGRSLAFDRKVGAYVDFNGFTLPPYQRHLAEQPDAVSRFADLLKRGNCSYDSGIIRRNALVRTGLWRDFYGSAGVMLMELALQGRFSMLDEKLFLQRFHPEASFYVAQADRQRWLNPAMGRSIRQPRFSVTRAYLEAIRNAQTLSRWERTQCLALVASKTTRRLPRRVFGHGMRPAPAPNTARAGR